MENRAYIIFFTIAIVVIGIFGFSIAGWYDTGIEIQNSVKAQYQDNQNVYDNGWKGLKEIAQIPDKYKDDFKEVLQTEGESTFGEGGSKALVQWFKQRNVTLDPGMYTRIQDYIEAWRNDFKRGQMALLDKQRSFASHRDTTWGRICRTLVDPLEDLKGDLVPRTGDFDGDGRLTVLDYRIVTSTKTQETFASGKDDEPQKVF